MSYEDLLSQIYTELPHLKGQLSAPKVVYVKAQGKVYITFESGVLVEYASFIRMERLLRRIFTARLLLLRKKALMAYSAEGFFLFYLPIYRLLTAF